MSTKTVPQILELFASSYKESTPKKVKVLDLYLVCILATAVVQVVYCFLVGSFPFNSFLSGFLAAVGMFVLTVGLRVQVMEGKENFAGRSVERAFAEYVFCCLILFLAAFNLMG